MKLALLALFALPLAANPMKKLVIILACAALLVAQFPKPGGSTGGGAGLVVNGSLTLTGQTGDIAAQTLLATSHAAGLYQICVTAVVTTLDAGGTPEYIALALTSPFGAETVEIFRLDPTLGGSPVEAGGGCIPFRSTGATAITLNPPNAATAVYNLYATAVRLQ